MTDSFFYPIVHIRLAHSQNFAYSATARSRIVHFHCKFFCFFVVFVFFRGKRKSYSAFRAHYSLCSRAIKSSFDFFIFASAVRTYFCYFFHSHHPTTFYHIVRYLSTSLQVFKAPLIRELSRFVRLRVLVLESPVGFADTPFIKGGFP